MDRLVNLISTATDTAAGTEKAEETENKDDNENIDENKNDTNDTNENQDTKEDKEKPPLKKQITSTTVTKEKSKSDIKKKLRNILDGVASQETDLKRKTTKLEEWYNIHTDALKTAKDTKKMLIEFDVINEDDSEQVKTTKTKNKTEINSHLDKLEKKLKKINITEKKYRSRESIKEANELATTVKKLQDKYKIVSQKYNSQIGDIEKLTKVNTENETKIKTLIENHKKSIEEMKKSIENKHKNYITNLQSQHENALKRQKDETVGQYEKKIEELKNEKDMEVNKLSNELKTVSEELSEFKLRETAHKELMLKWQSQKEKKNSTINELSKTLGELNDKIENFEEMNQKLQENAAYNNIQMTQKDESFNEFENKYNVLNEKHSNLEKDKKLLEAKLKVSIKEIIKLRGESKSKDENKSILLTEMSNLEIDKNKKINNLESEISKLENEILLINKEFIKQFEIFGGNLNDVHSKLEFFVTIQNFSANKLKGSYNNDIFEASKKSNQELPALQGNIRTQVRKASEQISLDSVTNVNENNEKQQEIIKECKDQIAHIKLTGLQLLDEYTSLLMRYNELYISHCNYLNKEKNDKQSNNKNIFSKRKKSNNKKTSNQ